MGWDSWEGRVGEWRGLEGNGGELTRGQRIKGSEDQGTGAYR